LLKVEDVLRTATINAAKMLQREKEQPKVEPGKLADLDILDADPLADIKNIRRIFVSLIYAGCYSQRSATSGSTCDAFLAGK
jgi:imidazolonepropionase-like amidohydrolase